MRTPLALFLLAAACAPAERPAPPPASTQAPAPTTLPRADAWLGEWKGVEGTFLRLERKGTGYAVTIANLDGPRTFDAAAEGDVVTFTRDGKHGDDSRDGRRGHRHEVAGRPEGLPRGHGRQRRVLPVDRLSSARPRRRTRAASGPSRHGTRG